MKKQLFILAFAFAAVTLTACRKKALFSGNDCSGNCFILTGKLIDSAINTGISGGEIKFFYKTTGWLFTTTYIGKTTTDQNGNYNFRFDAARFLNTNGIFYAEAYKDDLFGDPNYKNLAGSFQLDSVHLNNTVTKDFSLFRPSTLQVHVVAPNAANYGYVQVEYHYGRVNHGFSIKGQKPIDTILTFKTAGDINTFVKVKALPHSLNVQKTDTLVVPANGTKLTKIQL